MQIKEINLETIINLYQTKTINEGAKELGVSVSTFNNLLKKIPDLKRKGCGKHSKFNPSKEFFENLYHNMTTHEIIKKHKISTTTYYKWLKKYGLKVKEKKKYVLSD